MPLYWFAPGAVAWAADVDGDRLEPDDGDGDDLDLTVHPGATEACDGVDDDGDGTTDEGGWACDMVWWGDHAHQRCDAELAHGRHPAPAQPPGFVTTAIAVDTTSARSTTMSVLLGPGRVPPQKEAR